MSDRSTCPGRPGFVALAAVLVLAGGAGGWMWQSYRAGSTAGMASGDRAAIERVVHDYILDHPEILPEAMDRLRKDENAKQLAGVQDEVGTPYPGVVLGNPRGKVTLVEFTDYACTYCRQSLAEVDALIVANPDLKVVVRELPILSPGSGEAARWAIAAAEQGRYAAFHQAMFAAGRPDAATIEAAATAAGLDLDRARRTASDPEVAAELSRNVELARELGFSGTPSWVVGDQLMTGAVGRDALTNAIAEARG